MWAITLKFAADNDASPFLFVVVASVVATILAYIQKSLVLRKQSVEDAAEHKRTNASAKRLAFGLWVVNALGIFFIFKATEVSLSISYTINSFYILIPIILSMIIYKEHMNLRKGVAIVLSLLAIIFFQI